LQRDTFAEAGCGQIFTERLSGAVTDRPAFHETLEFARRGDTLMANSDVPIIQIAQHLDISLSTLDGTSQPCELRILLAFDNGRLRRYSRQPLAGRHVPSATGAIASPAMTLDLRSSYQSGRKSAYPAQSDYLAASGGRQAPRKPSAPFRAMDGAMVRLRALR
jgi:hypothetical protein